MHMMIGARVVECSFTQVHYDILHAESLDVTREEISAPMSPSTSAHEQLEHRFGYSPQEIPSPAFYIRSINAILSSAIVVPFGCR